MEKLIWWLRRCLECWDESIELVDSDEPRVYREDEEWDNMWAALEMPLLVEGDAMGVFPGLDGYLIKPNVS